MYTKTLIMAIVIIFTFAGCSTQNDQIAGRWYTGQQVHNGQELFQQYCSSCHGQNGEGTTEWKKRDAVGNLPPPPLNGSAHAWHHSIDILTKTITEGGAAWQGTMPAFGNQLNPEQKQSVIAFIQSLWSDEIYQRWADVNMHKS